MTAARAWARRMGLLAAAAIGAAAGASATACDPVQAEAIDRLGPEKSGVPKGPRHRAGQPCMTCHASDSIATPFTAAGTIYKTYGSLEPLAGATVQLTDARGATIAALTNEVGNFYLLPSQWTPIYPVTTAISFGGVTTEMKTRIGRDGSCADCHLDPEGPGSAGHIRLVVAPADYPGAAPP